MALVPYVIEQSSRGERSFDIYSRLLEDRIVMLNEEVNSASASVVVAQLLYLESKDPTKDISLYINSPGGSVTDGFAIFDTMNYIKCDVSTICMGMAASMGAFLLAAGAKGKRLALPNSDIMIHQPSGGAQGQATDMEIHTRHILDMKTYMQYMGMDANALKGMYKEEAEKRVKLRLALEAVARKENIEVTEADLDAEYGKMAEAYKMDVDKVKEAVPAESLTEDIKVEKALNLVKDKAVIK